jgi:hypothetical protein
MTKSEFKPVPHDAAFHKALLAKPGVQKAFDALQQTTYLIAANLPGSAPCSLCGKGPVTARIDDVESEHHGTKAMVALHYAVCSACTSEFTDAEHSRLNKQAVLAFRSSVQSL